MTIQDSDAFVRNLWDWACLDGCFGDTRIQATDIDGAVERCGQFLFIETKEPGVILKQGQRIFYSALAQKSGVTVFVVWGKTGKPEELQVYANNGISKRYVCDLDKLRRFVAKWFELANKRLPVSIRQDELERR